MTALPPRQSPADKLPSRWEEFAERGSLAALRFMARLYELLGRRLSRAVLHPIAAYFFVFDRGSLAPSRRYLERVWLRPEGRARLRGRPGFFAPYWHYHEFALQIFDRMVLWGHGLSELRMDHQGSEHLFALKREQRGGILIGAVTRRAIFEEQTLQRELPGYDEYMKRVRYRLIPGIW